MNKKIIIIAGSLALTAVIGFGVYQTNADANVLFQPTGSGETEKLEIREKDIAEPRGNTVAKAEKVERKATVSQKENAKIKSEKTAAEITEFTLTRAEVREQLTAEYPGIITEFELGQEDGRWIYEVDLYGPDAEYELEMGAETGEIIKFEQERNNGRKYEVLSGANLITMSEAENIALNEFAGIIKEVELDREDGRIIYEIEIKDGKNEAELDIDASTGEIIKLEFEYEG